MAQIEARVGGAVGVGKKTADTNADDNYLMIRRRQSTSLAEVFDTLLRRYPRRTVLGLTLIGSQAFLYNAIFFTYALVLVRFYDVLEARTGIYLLPFAIGNFLGPLLLGRLFDTLGRRVCISATYAISGVLLVSAALFVRGALDAQGQMLLWAAIFFFASAAASAAYLTVSELFPLEIRALAIAVFFAVETALGGVAAPWLFGSLIGIGSRELVSFGYVFGAVLMLIAAAVEVWLGVDSERTSLEPIAPPLSTRN